MKSDSALSFDIKAMMELFKKRQLHDKAPRKLELPKGSYWVVTEEQKVTKYRLKENDEILFILLKI